MTLPQTFSERSLAVPRDSRAVIFPLEWVLATGSPPVQYRALRDVARLPNASSRFPAIILSHAPVLTLSLAQRPDGTWNGEMLTTPSRSDAFDTGVQLFKFAIYFRGHGPIKKNANCNGFD